MALNVNFPDALEGAQWRLTWVGSYNAYLASHTPDMAAAASPAQRESAAQRGIELVSFPGIDFDFNTAEPLPHQLADESVVFRQHIAVSPMQAGCAAATAEDMVRWQLGALLGG